VIVAALRLEADGIWCVLVDLTICQSDEHRHVISWSCGLDILVGYLVRVLLRLI